MALAPVEIYTGDNILENIRIFYVMALYYYILYFGDAKDRKLLIEDIRKTVLTTDVFFDFSEIYNVADICR
jgi:hypothetical protein